MKLSIVIPMRNEAGNVSSLLAEIDAIGPLLPHHEIVCVDDGSDDDTGATLRAIAARRSADAAPLRVLSHRSGVGQSGALRSGIRAAQGEWIVTLDGDGQNDPADILELLDALAANPGHAHRSLVAGERVGRKDSWLRRCSSRIANAVRRRLLDDGARDTGCALKLFPRALFLELPFFDHLHRFLPALCRAEGAEVLFVPVTHRPRRAGISKYGVGNRLWVGLVDLAGVLWLQRRRVIVELDDVAAREPAPGRVGAGEPAPGRVGAGEPAPGRVGAGELRAAMMEVGR